MNFISICLGLIGIVCLVLPPGPASAIDPGTADGWLQVNTKTIPLRHSYAHLHDNTEGLLDRTRELRIVLSDREIRESALSGMVGLPVQDMAKKGTVQGLLIRLDPSSPSSMQITLLYPPANPEASLLTQTIGGTGARVLKEFKMMGQRVSGAIENHDRSGSGSVDLPKLAYSVKFSAPLFREAPITGNLKGKEAASSPLVKILRKKASALAKGDFDAVRKLSSRDSYRRLEPFLAQLGPDAKTFAAQAAVDLEKSLSQIDRVVVRGERASVIFADKQWTAFIREDGEWKCDD
jgi:hypothetical protein